MTTAKTPVAASLVGVLALTACSGGGSSVYDFTEPLTEPTSTIEFRVPDELVELSAEYAQERVFESITVSAVDSEDPSLCSLEFEAEYVDGALDGLIAYIEGGDRYDSVDDGMANLLTGEDLDEIELSEDYTAASVPVECASSPTDDENTVEVDLWRLNDDIDGFADAEVAVMTGGELYVHEPEVEDWEVDSNGNWIRAE